MHTLKSYQERSLSALESYFKLCVEYGAKTAFVIQTERSYRSVPQLPGLPYVCLRVPTGGGKTLMACHAIGLAAANYLQAARATVLWLVPSNAIKDQTLAALKDREHPYRQALDARFPNVSVMDLAEALYIQRGTLAGDTCVIVSTLAALRVEDTDGRKVYEMAGALQHHFSGLSEQQLAALERNGDGVLVYSLANVLRLNRPVIIMDEAHNARTQLSFEMLARLNPSCIVEFTATPETTHAPDKGKYASNVLHQTSAAELKAEEMVKLPIKLRTRTEWKETVGEAVRMREELERIAKEEERLSGEYLRPIVLHQAQAKSKSGETLTVDVVKACLMEDFRVPENQIAVATGDTREIDDVNLFSRECPIRHIITVQALKEGWDCNFAYVLCSVQESRSARAVEQVLGRILRMPKAKRKQHPELNCAYAYASSPHFDEAANAIKDALVENGFERIEADKLVIQAPDAPGAWDLFATHETKVEEAPNLAKLPPALAQRVTFDGAKNILTVNGPLNPGIREQVAECFTTPAAKQAVRERLAMTRPAPARPASAAPHEERSFAVPALALRVQGELELFEAEHFQDEAWTLNEAPVDLPGFSKAEPDAKDAELDISDAGKVEWHFVAQVQEQISRLLPEFGWTPAALVNWLDRAIPHPDLTQAQSTLYIARVLEALTASGWTLEELAAKKYRLRGVLERRLADMRAGKAREAYQRCLFGAGAVNVEVSPEVVLTLDEARYAPNWLYEGRYTFQKHLFQSVGELKGEGEEFECAVFLDTLPEVDFWVRNIERRPEASFWLQTSTDKFYPDFVARLKDGRVLVVEYKGEHLWSNDDSKEKRAVGELWADRSKGACLFVMPKGREWEAVRGAVLAE